MRRFRWVLFGFAILLLLVLVVGLLLRAQIRLAWPQVDGELYVDGITAPVEIIRDSTGVPHIYAGNTHDLFFAQGYVHAQDRFWQMEFWRRIGSGRLSEILGESAIGQDRFIRTLGWRSVAEAEVRLLDADTLAILEAYAEGVNAYLAQRGHQGRRLGIEFTILALTGARFEPEPWSPADTLTWGKVMAWDLGGNMDAELDRARLTDLIGSERLIEYDVPYPDDHPVIVPSAAAAAAGASSAEPASLPEVAALAQLWQQMGGGLVFGEGSMLGSNSWVVSGAKSATGSPILANDPHLGIQMPSIWYQVGLHSDDFEVAGFSFAGMPGVVIGHNARIAWGLTNVGPDVQDLYVEKLNPQNPDQYEFEGEWVEMDLRYETIEVAGRDDPVVIKVRSTRHGPIINDVLHGATSAWAYGWQPLALRWTALEPGSMASSVLGLSRAQNWDQFREALSMWDVPSQNMIYADVDGNIGYQMPGRIPIRAQGDGSAPVPGWSGEYEWEGWIPFEELPNSYNPPEGYIVTANNPVVDASYPYFISRDWALGYRAQRIVDLLTEQEKFSLVDMARIQMDSYDMSAAEVLPFLLELEPAEPDLVEALELLGDWDLQMRRESTPAALYGAFWVHLVDNLLADDLGERPGGYREKLLVRELLSQPDSLWWDDVGTVGEVETRDVILERALADGVSWLRDELGGKMEGWQWGDYHTATFRNQSLGESGISVVEGLFNRGPVPVDGGTAIVNATGWSAREPAEVTALPSLRQIIDLGDLANSLSVHTTGQSGHPYHQHYGDMIPAWQEGALYPMLWERSAIVADEASRLILTPAD